MRASLLVLSAALLATACSSTENPDEDNENEVITTVTLTLTPQGGGDAVEATWTDPENDGSPVIDDLGLVDGTTYDVAVRFLNELSDPADDITVEVDGESDEHQVFYLGGALDLITVAYDDTDSNGFPVGLATTWTVDAAGSGDLTVVLRHLPPVNDVAVKTATLADDVASGGLSSIGGTTDAQVTFPVSVP